MAITSVLLEMVNDASSCIDVAWLGDSREVERLQGQISLGGADHAWSRHPSCPFFVSLPLKPRARHTWLCHKTCVMAYSGSTPTALQTLGCRRTRSTMQPGVLREWRDGISSRFTGYRYGITPPIVRTSIVCVLLLAPPTLLRGKRARISRCTAAPRPRRTCIPLHGDWILFRW